MTSRTLDYAVTSSFPTEADFARPQTATPVTPAGDHPWATILGPGESRVGSRADVRADGNPPEAT